LSYWSYTMSLASVFSSALRRIRRYLAPALAACSILGGGLHLVAPRVGWAIGQRIPPLRYGYVMFNQMPSHIEVVEWRRESEPYRPLKELLNPLSIGYGSSRLALAIRRRADLLPTACRAGALGRAELKTTGYELGNGRKVVSRRVQICDGSHLIDAEPRVGAR